MAERQIAVKNGERVTIGDEVIFVRVADGGAQRLIVDDSVYVEIHDDDTELFAECDEQVDSMRLRGGARSTEEGVAGLGRPRRD